MDQRWFRIGLIGAVVALICCLTPLALIVLGVLGLGAFAAWVDLIAVPTFVIFAAITLVAYLNKRAV